ncbi:hypothetical protein SUGI_0318450 [Cryptomeria japonica]|nr:hypothetical protein SUGI_0318450 [Cryptomeria japonica]
MISSDPEYRYLGPGLEAHLYYTDSETYSAFIANTDQTKDLATTFNGNTYSLSAWSMSILPDCKNVVFNTTLPESNEGFTWIGGLTLGDYHFRDFREISVERRYITSLYFAIVTMATVGYGDIHAMNTREMIFVMIYVSFDMILGAYLIGGMTALVVKGSKTERFRDRMTDLIRYMNRNKLGRDIRA